MNDAKTNKTAEAKATEAKSPKNEAPKNEEKKATVADQLDALKKQLAKARGEKLSAAKKEKKEIPGEPKSVKISAEHTMDKELGFVHVDVKINNFVYRSFPKDTGKGIARTIVMLDGEQQHKFNNIGMQNALTSFIDDIKDVDPKELDSIIYYSLKARRDEIKSIDKDLLAQAADIRAERRQRESEEREARKQARIRAKEQEIKELEAKIKELEANAKKADK